MHISSLPGRYGIGDFGPQAYIFAEKAASAGFKYWQMLPLGPTGYGNSPYSALSAFAGNELLISPDMLVKDGFLTKEEADEAASALKDEKPSHVDFQHVKQVKVPLLRKAALRALSNPSFKSKLESFCSKNSYWLDDYSLYHVLTDKYNDSRWYSIWDDKLRIRDKKTLEEKKSQYKDEIEICKVIQFFFDLQIKAFQSYIHERGLLTIGDIPIFVGKDSVDAWSNLKLFKTDGKGHFTDVSGVPPDNFSPDGQLWGTPVYNWAYHLKTDFEWWVLRLKRAFELNDIVRIDHFRGFDAYYEIKAEATTAKDGVWIHAPGFELFDRLRKVFGKDLPIIAEDLGNITESVIRLRKTNRLPGMKIAQFGFELTSRNKIRMSHEFLSKNYTRKFVAYTGTHDNDTTLGWFNSIDDNLKREVLSYLHADEKTLVKALVKNVLESRADTAVIPMQDILEKDGTCRMNYPSTCNDINWSWRMQDGEFTQALIEEYRSLITASGR